MTSLKHFYAIDKYSPVDTMSSNASIIDECNQATSNDRDKQPMFQMYRTTTLRHKRSKPSS